MITPITQITQITCAIVLVAALHATSAERTVLQSELIERTLAIVAGQAITLSDVQTARALMLVDGADQQRALEQLIDRALMLREVDRYAPLDPEPSAVEQRLAGMRNRLGNADFERVVAAGGFTEARLRGWIRDDLRIQAYLNQRFTATGVTGQSREDLIADWVSDLRRRTPVVELWKK